MASTKQYDDVIADGEEEGGGSSEELLRSWLMHDDIGFHYFSTDEAAQIRHKLIVWYRRHRRKLPWRGDPPPWNGSTASTKTKKQQQHQQQTTNTITSYFATTTKPSGKTKKKKEESATIVDDQEDPSLQQQRTYPVTAYGVWVSEIMLQQTRVEAVIPKWCLWMDKFPTVQELAAAQDDEINQIWAGLGFYRRAKLLHNAAKYVVKTLDGEIPNNVPDLMELPGIGRYTASAIASIYYNVSVPVVDGNVCRVLSRLRCIANHIKANPLKDVHGWTLAAQLVDVGTATDDDDDDDDCSPGEINQALMELGATYCAPSGTGTDPNDPLREFYWSTRLGMQVSQCLNDNTTTTLTIPDSSKRTCPVCAENGIEEALENMRVTLEGGGNDAASKCGHAAFPLAPPKKAKKEDVLAVAAIARLDENGEPASWLLVRRPDKGLLAGQWEFPAACVWTSEPTTAKARAKTPKNNGKKRKDMSDQVPSISATVRRKAVTDLLSNLLTKEDSTSHASSAAVLELRRTQVADAPLEHIFSHVRHTMWVEHAATPMEDDDDDDVRESSLDDWVNVDNRQLRWMSESDMKNVGVTSGFRKILHAVKQHITEVKQSGSTKHTTRTKQKGQTKRGR